MLLSFWVIPLSVFCQLSINLKSEWLLFNAIAIFQLYHCKKKLIFNTLSWIFIVLALWNNSPQVDMSLYSEPSYWFRANQSLLFFLKATNTNFIVFGLTRLLLEPTIYCTEDEHANHYANNVVKEWGHQRKLLLFYIKTI